MVNISFKGLFLKALVLVFFLGCYSICAGQQTTYRDTLINKLHFAICSRYEVSTSSCSVYEYPNLKSVKKYDLALGSQVNPVKTVGEFYYITYKDRKGKIKAGWIVTNGLTKVDSIVRVN
ncbi:MAG TPA: hypothetical protein VHA52_05705 [Candidatus Babeliaceae bacterium]|nr:hypothetical protein [Candidatus Babeliaceae bacterium]